MPSQNKRIALISPHLTRIGEAIAMPLLARGLANLGYNVDLLAAWQEWQQLESFGLPENVRVVSLNTRRIVPFIPDITRISPWAAYRVWGAMVGVGMAPGIIWYLNKQKPDALIGRMLTTQTIIAKRLSRSNTKLVLGMAGFPRDSALRRFLWPRLYKYVDAFVAPTFGVAERASHFAKISSDKFTLITNPVLTKEIFKKADEPLEHRWFNDPNTKVVLGVGRLTNQKDFHTLLRAFALVHQKINNVKLVIIGEGEQRTNLNELANQLGISNHFELYGETSNPYKFMKNAAVYVMSSLWEGPGHALIEAVSLGVPSVSTNCKSGPEDTTLNGKAGLLTPVGDAQAMSEAIIKVLTDKALAAAISKAGSDNADRYLDTSVAKEWASLIENLTS